MKTYTQYLGENQDIYVKCLINDVSAPNVIFFMTPVGSVDHELAVDNYGPLFDNGLNVFAVDLPGIGNSSEGAFTYANIKAAIRCVGEHIKESYSAPIHLYGGTGTGGLIGQALAWDKDLPFFKSYSQFGVANYLDLSVLGNDLILKLSYPFMTLGAKICPKHKLKFKIPEYNGYNAKKENNWYRSIIQDNPSAFDMPVEVIHTILWILLSKESPLKNKSQLPTLVMASKHDRYFTEKYIKTYYKSLTSTKKLRWFNDSHCIFVWDGQTLADEVTKWVQLTNE